jgi:integration host factor subunit beta
MATTTKKELIDRIAIETQQKRVFVKQTIQAFLDEVVAEIGRGNRLEFRDFGVFEIRMRATRVAQNPKTLEPVTVPAKRTVKFKLGRKMRACLDKMVAPAGTLAASQAGLNGVVVKTRKRAKVAV